MSGAWGRYYFGAGCPGRKDGWGAKNGLTAGESPSVAEEPLPTGVGLPTLSICPGCVEDCMVV